MHTHGVVTPALLSELRAAGQSAADVPESLRLSLAPALRPSVTSVSED